MKKKDDNKQNGPILDANTMQSRISRLRKINRFEHLDHERAK
ncbi:MAG: hypothetical protein AAF570_11400 [Bacteroidota bacterium]